MLQFLEGLSDRQAADAVRDRIARKYTLGLELTNPGFDASVLSEFRDRLIAGQAELSGTVVHGLFRHLGDDPPLGAQRHSR